MSDSVPYNLPRLKAFVLTAGLLVVLTPLAGFGQDNNAAAPAPAATSGTEMPSLWDLAVQGGVFMIPIALASIVSISFSIERLYGLRNDRILPATLVLSLRELTSESGIDPRTAWKVCQDFPSPLANVLRAAILKTGRPHAEVEKTTEDAVGRETGDMSRNLRPINVVASIAPLLGLLGTVQGMIMAFMVTSTTSSTGAAKAQELAGGIYAALVTTFAGLCVAVTSVLLANFLEGRIEKLLRQMEDIFLDLLPQFERFEGKFRVARAAADDDDSGVLLKASRQTATSTNGGATKSASPRTIRPKPAKPEPSGVAENFVPDSGLDFKDGHTRHEPVPDGPSKVESPNGLWDVMWEHREAQKVVEEDGDEL